MEQPKSNPLKNYFRQYKMYIRLPSGTSYYKPNVVEFTEGGELGILAMTGRDELILKNPDALLNGEALVEVISSCVPGVKNPRLLLSNDIDALMTAIKAATYNDKIETDVACPNCGHVNSFKVDLEHVVNGMTYLDPEYVVNLSNGLSVFVKPYGFNEVLTLLHVQFEQSKITKNLANDRVSENEKIKIFGVSFTELAKVTYHLIANSIVRVVNEADGIDVSSPEHIREFLHNIEKHDIDQISEMIDHINRVGIEKQFPATCEKCNHEWKSEIDFNPVNFS